MTSLKSDFQYLILYRQYWYSKYHAGQSSQSIRDKRKEHAVSIRYTGTRVAQIQVHAKDVQGRTILQIVCGRGHTFIEEILRAALVHGVVSSQDNQNSVRSDTSSALVFSRSPRTSECSGQFSTAFDGNDERAGATDQSSNCLGVETNYSAADRSLRLADPTRDSTGSDSNNDSLLHQVSEPTERLRMAAFINDRDHKALEATRKNLADESRVRQEVEEQLQQVVMQLSQIQEELSQKSQALEAEIRKSTFISSAAAARVSNERIMTKKAVELQTHLQHVVQRYRERGSALEAASAHAIVLEGELAVLRERLVKAGTPWIEISPSDVHIDMSQRLGRGSFKVVCKGEFRGSVVAVAQLLDPAGVTVQERHELLHELRTMSRLSHPRIVTLIAATSIDCPSPLVVMEYLSGGTLFAALHHKHTNAIVKGDQTCHHHELVPSERLRIMRDIVEAVAFLHGVGMAHRDMKSPNVLLDMHRNAKLCDLGMAKAKEMSADRNTTRTGTTRWRAPEVTHHAGAGYDPFAADVYSTALVLYEVATSVLPFSEIQDEVAIAIAVQNGDRPDPVHLTNASSSSKAWLPAGTISAIMNGWNQNAHERPAALQLLGVLPISGSAKRITGDIDREPRVDCPAVRTVLRQVTDVFMHVTDAAEHSRIPNARVDAQAALDWIRHNTHVMAPGMTEHTAAALRLYTMEGSSLFYVKLNEALRATSTENIRNASLEPKLDGQKCAADVAQQCLEPFMPFLALLRSAYLCCPQRDIVLWRGIKADISQWYRDAMTGGRLVWWWGVSSCTECAFLLEEEKFCGAEGRRTIFQIETTSRGGAGAVSVQAFSEYPSENERILLPGVSFAVTSVASLGSGLSLVTLRQTDSPATLSDAPAAGSSSYQDDLRETYENVL